MMTGAESDCVLNHAECLGVPHLSKYKISGKRGRNAPIRLCLFVPVHL